MARAQAEEIWRTLKEFTPDAESPGGLKLSGSSADAVRLQAQVDVLQAQVQAWMRAAEAIQAKFDHASKPVREDSVIDATRSIQIAPQTVDVNLRKRDSDEPGYTV
jgi:hypothetical protein